MIDRSPFVTFVNDKNGLTYVLYETYLEILDRRCEVINSVEVVDIPKAKTKSANDNEKQCSPNKATGLLIDQHHGYLFVFLDNSSVGIYQLATLNFFDDGYPIDPCVDDSFRYAPSALTNGEPENFWFNMFSTSTFFNIRYSYATKSFHSHLLSEDSFGKAAVLESEQEKAVDHHAPCSPVSEEWNMVFHDWKHNSDIIVGQHPFGHKLHFMVVHYHKGNYKTHCTKMDLPKNITGKLATWDGAQHHNHLYMSFAPSASMVEVRFRVKVH